MPIDFPVDLTGVAFLEIIVEKQPMLIEPVNEKNFAMLIWFPQTELPPNVAPGKPIYLTHKQTEFGNEQGGKNRDEKFHVVLGRFTSPHNNGTHIPLETATDHTATGRNLLAYLPVGTRVIISKASKTGFRLIQPAKRSNN